MTSRPNSGICSAHSASSVSPAAHHFQEVPVLKSPVGLRITSLASALAAALMCVSAYAQTPPTSGELLQQIPPPTPQRDAVDLELTVEQAQDHAADDNVEFDVSRVVVEGNTSFQTATLHALVMHGEGQTHTLQSLSELAGRITSYYRDQGYPLARAIVPAQALDEGVVRIQVVEARYDEIELVNGTRVRDNLLSKTLSPLQSGDFVEQASLDRSLLLLGELPGVRPRATLRPGRETGTSALVVQAEPDSMVSGVVTLDNAGNRYTGRVRLGAWLQVDNPLRHGDQLSIGALTAGGDLSYGRLGYQFTVNGVGTRLGASYSVLDYSLGDDLEALGAHGTAHVASVWVNQPLVRSRVASLDANLQFDRKKLRDRIDSVALRGDRHTDSWTLGLYGERQDVRGINRASLSVTHGDLEFDDAIAALSDAGTANTAGTYTRWNASLERLQPLTVQTSLWMSISGQGSGDNLDSSEQFLLGGPNSVRGYAVGALAGSSGHLASVALRRDLGWFDAGHTVGSLFLDHGALRINANRWTDGENHVRIQSAGVGIEWQGANRWNAQLQVATPIGSSPDLIGDQDDIRAWLLISKGF